MIYRIQHVTRFAYSRSVFLEPITVRLRPRVGPDQELVAYGLETDPAPAGRTAAYDVVGNAVEMLWFDGMSESLELTSRCTVRTLRENPFDFIIPDPSMAELPLSYPQDLQVALLAYRVAPEGPDPVSELADEAVRISGPDLLPFCETVTRMIHERVSVVIREEGDPLPPEATLRFAQASCRDLTVLWNDVCRRVGIATRFVSGYQEGDPDTEHRHLHAWAEAYIPGGGWRGWDPTLGLAVADRHIPLAAAPTPQGAAPTSGTFRGTGAVARMAAEIQLESDLNDRT